MQFLVKAYDGPNMLEKRMAVRPRHLEGMKALGKQIIAAGGVWSTHLMPFYTKSLKTAVPT